LDLYAQLDRRQPGKNLFFSPTSISLALGMTAAGARGPTQSEMVKVLHLDADLAQAHAHYHQLLSQWNAGPAGLSGSPRVPRPHSPALRGRDAVAGLHPGRGGQPRD
jgi:hypothetical protein